MRRLGQYRIEGKLGQGGMGAVYRAVDEQGRTCALKVLRDEYVGNDEYRGRFLREARIALRLAHPHVVRTFDAGEVNGQLYLASELVEGGDLAGLLEREGPLSERRALLLIRGVVLALDHAHGNGLIHRDVKPENILLTLDETPKLADLGLARGVSAEATRFTHSGEAIGTPSYLAPEQARGDVELDIRCDLYAVGATLYELLVGTPPYTGPNFMAILHAHVYESIPDPAEARPELSLGLRRLVNDLLQKTPEKRPTTPAVVIERIDLLLETAADQKPASRRSSGSGEGAFPATLIEAAPELCAPPEATATPEITGASGSNNRTGSAVGAPDQAHPVAPHEPPEATATPPAFAEPSKTTPEPGKAPPAPAETPALPTGAPVPRSISATVAMRTGEPDHSWLQPSTAQRRIVATPDTVRPKRFGVEVLTLRPPAGTLLSRLRLTRTTGPNRTLFAIGGARLQLGRDGVDRSDNDVTTRVLPGPEHREDNMRISGSHLELSLTATGAALQDLHAANGTKVDGAPVSRGGTRALLDTHTLELAGTLSLRVTHLAPHFPTIAIRDDKEAEVRCAALGALLLERLENREDVAYALIGDVLPLEAFDLFFCDGALYARAERNALRIDGAAVDLSECVALCAGVELSVGEASFVVHRIRPEDMK